jgi:hypothetical protein
MQRKTIDADIDVVLQAENIYDDGCIEITTQSLNDKLITGTFMLSRADSRSNFTTWNRIYNFTLEGEKIKKKLWRDYTIE